MRPPRRPHPAPRRAADGGFTMIEVLVAATLFIVGALATLALLDNGAQATGSSLAKDRGNAVAQELTERTSGMRYTRTANDLVAPTAAAGLRKAMDPTATGPITTEQVGDLVVPRYRWSVRRANTNYAVTYRACTSSDRVGGLIVQGPQDCDALRECKKADGTPCNKEPIVLPSCGAGLALGLLTRPSDVAADVKPSDITIRLQLLNLGSLAVADVEACVGELTAGLGLAGLVNPLCGLLGDPSSLLAPVNTVLGGVLGALSSGTKIGLCPKADVEGEVPEITSGIAASTRIETTVEWHDRFANKDRRIRQTAVVRRGAPQVATP